jgi:hypothetical protein
MRQTISGLIAAIALVATAAPALACGDGLFTGSCAPCGEAYGGGCAQGYYGGGYRHTADEGPVAYERLPESSPQYFHARPQYFYANQGPTYSGPGMFAPVPTYQESAVSGWGAYNHSTYYGYDGGRYANATNHYYDGMPAAEGPVIYSYRAHPHFRPWRARTGYYGAAPRYSLLPRAYDASHRSMRYGARFTGPRTYGHREQVLRHYN